VEMTLAEGERRSQGELRKIPQKGDGLTRARVPAYAQLTTLEDPRA
jgi:hypothetical protein